MNEKLIQGLLGFGSGMLSGNYGRYGQFGPALGQGLQGFQQATNDYTQNSLREKQLAQLEAYQKAQMGHLQTQDRLAQEKADNERRIMEQRAKLYAPQGTQQAIPQQPVQLPPINPGNPMINTSPVLPSFANFAESSLMGGDRLPSLGKDKPKTEFVTAKKLDFWSNPVEIRKKAMEAQAIGATEDANFFITLADKVEREFDKDRDRKEKTFTDNDGITRYISSGEPVAQQHPKLPEGFEMGANGRPQPIKEYWDQKERVASASASNISFGSPVAGVDPSGKPVFFQPSKGGGKPSIVPGVAPPEKANSSDSEKLAAGFHDRMTEAEKNMTEVGSKGYPTAGSAVASSIPKMGKYAERVYMSQEQQRYRQAQEDWVRAKLRKESGATIQDEEMNREIATYFPQVGDGPDVIAQKERARKTALDAMLRSAGRASDAKKGRVVVRTGMYQGKKVVEYDDGSVEYAE